MKKIFIFLFITIFIVACSSSNSSNETSTTSTNSEPSVFNVDLQVLFGSDDNSAISSNSYLKITGSYGDYEGKIDAVSGASTPSASPKALNEYRAKDGKVIDNRIEFGIAEFLLFGTASADKFMNDGVSINTYAQKVVGENVGPKVEGTGITKDANGVITIRFAHALGTTLTPYLFEMKSDENGVFKIGQGTENFKRTANPVTNDINFSDAVLIVDTAKAGIPYWVGDLQATYENNILTIQGTLTETNN